MQKMKKYGIGVIVGALILLTVCGSFFDYEIADALYCGQKPSDNFFGVLFAFIGIIPTFVGWGFLGGSLFYLSRKHVRSLAKRRWLTALSVLLFVLAFFYFCNTLMMVNGNAFSVHWAIAYSIGTAVVLLATYAGYALSKYSDTPQQLKTVLFLTVVSIVVMIIVMSVKGIMDRPRFRFVLETSNPDYFRNWWQSGGDVKAALGTNAVSDEFSSFPSGHSAYSMFAVFLFPALADYIPKLHKQKPLLFALGFVWWGLTALSRLTVGAHYLTDVCIAGLATIAAYGIVKGVCRWIAKRKNTEDGVSRINGAEDTL